MHLRLCKTSGMARQANYRKTLSTVSTCTKENSITQCPDKKFIIINVNCILKRRIHDQNIHQTLKAALSFLFTLKLQDFQINLNDAQF